MSEAPKSKTAWLLWGLATLVAISGVMLTVFQGFENRRHNRLSVKPLLTIELLESNTDPVIGLSLSNQGAGLAVIDDWEIYVDNHLVGKRSDGWREALKQLKEINEEWVSYGSFRAIKSGDSRSIFSVRQDKWEKRSPEDQANFKKALRRIRLMISYSSVYHESVGKVTYP